MTAPKKNALTWRKSSYSNGGSACVEVASSGESAAVRDSKAADGPALAFPTPQWRRFLGTLS
jgi:hypothetical protein